MLHLTNGDSVAQTLRESGVRGEIVVWAETLHDGPIPMSVSREQWRQIRAHHYADCGFGSLGESLRTLTDWDTAVDFSKEHDEIILWLEHDLFDQLLLIRHLDWLSGEGLGSALSSLVCVDAFPGVERFVGLGQLNSSQLASLLPARRAITAEQFRLGRLAWHAFGSSNPRDLDEVLQGDCTPLPFLAAALRRWQEEFPSIGNGLGRTENAALSVVASGPRTGFHLFQECQRSEDRPFLGDSSFWHRLDHLARGADPLIEASPRGRVTGSTVLTLTEMGRRVLDGQGDAIRLNGIDRWLGGIHLLGHEVPWRWDQSKQRVISTPT
jgi:hypothetical protein